MTMFVTSLKGRNPPGLLRIWFPKSRWMGHGLRMSYFNLFHSHMHWLSANLESNKRACRISQNL